jgi:hypothetical protein
MKSMWIKLVVAAVLVSGSIVGGLVLTGRLDGSSAANIPVLRSLLPAPAEQAGARTDGRTPSGARARTPQRGTEDVRAVAAPDALFRFEGLPTGLTPEQINETWQRVQDASVDMEQRRSAIELRERELELLAEDVARRHRELATERAEIEELHRALDARIRRFQEQVKLVCTDEAPGLKRNAQTLAAFEPWKAAELIEEQWKTESGQDEVLKTLEFMDKNRLADILGELPSGIVQDLMQKRLRVVKEPAAPAPGR